MLLLLVIFGSLPFGIGAYSAQFFPTQSWGKAGSFPPVSGALVLSSGSQKPSGRHTGHPCLVQVGGGAGPSTLWPLKHTQLCGLTTPGQVQSGVQSLLTLLPWLQKLLPSLGDLGWEMGHFRLSEHGNSCSI